MEDKITLKDMWVPNKGEIELSVGKLMPYESNIVFIGKDNLEILRLEPNGDIYVKGNLAENDKEVVEGLRVFLTGHRPY